MIFIKPRILARGQIGWVGETCLSLPAIVVNVLRVGVLIARMAIVAGFALSGCSVLPASKCAPTEQVFVNETLYFGTSTPDGVVSAQQWADFLNDVVTPRFPRGFSSWPASGQWQSANGRIIRENSHVLAIDHRDDSRSNAAVSDIMALYRSEFHQEAVLRVRAEACVSF